MNKEDVLNSIFDNDPFNLLSVKEKKDSSQIEENRQDESLKEIKAFIQQTGHEPRPNKSDMYEYKLYSRMMSFHENSGALVVSEPTATYGVKKTVSSKRYNSFDDIFISDSFSLLNTDEENLFTISHFSQNVSNREETDFVSRRKPCKDFEKYEENFKNIQKDLKSGKRKLLQFEEKQLKSGTYFVHNGILLLLEKIIDIKQDKFGKNDGRTHVIFENGTESNMKYRSLGKNLFGNGYCVSETNEEFIKNFDKNFNAVSKEDKESGFIYVVSSESELPELKSMKNLYKIGFCTQTVEERIRNAKNESTYLYAPVRHIASWQCYNMNTEKLEDILHKFFNKSQLEIDTFDTNGRRFMPREWFIVPLPIIKQAIELIISNEIVNYEYDEKMQCIVKAKRDN